LYVHGPNLSEIFLYKKSHWGGQRFRSSVPETLRDGRRPYLLQTLADCPEAPLGQHPRPVQGEDEGL
jgi:hypothetical protein